MIKSELVQLLTAKCPHLYQRDLDRVVSVVLNEIIGALKQDNRVEIRGFGTFSAKERTARIGRNPRNGSSVEVTAKKAPAFKAGKEMRERLNAPTKVSTPSAEEQSWDRLD